MKCTLELIQKQIQALKEDKKAAATALQSAQETEKRAKDAEQRVNDSEKRVKEHELRVKEAEKRVVVKEQLIKDEEERIKKKQKVSDTLSASPRNYKPLFGAASTYSSTNVALPSPTPESSNISNAVATTPSNDPNADSSFGRTSSPQASTNKAQKVQATPVNSSFGHLPTTNVATSVFGAPISSALTFGATKQGSDVRGGLGAKVESARNFSNSQAHNGQRRGRGRGH